MGRFTVILEEQVKPIVVVFISGWIDASFSGIGMIYFFLISLYGSDLTIQNHVANHCHKIVSVL